MKSLVILNECMFSKNQKLFLKKKFSDVVFYNDTNNEQQAIDRIGHRNIIIMDQFVFSFSEKLLKACPNLELVILNTTAYDEIDLNLLNRYGVKLLNLREYATEDVAEVAISMIFALNTYSQIGQKIVNGEYLGISNYNHREKTNDIWPGHPIIKYIKRGRLKNQVIGIVGLGKIGQKCAEMLNTLGVKVIGFNRSKKHINNVDIVTLKDLFRKSDIIVIALSYTKNANECFIDQELLSLAKEDAILISIAHPNLIELTYLIKNPNKFRGIGFDYLVTSDVRKLMKRRKNNIIVTPHLGSQSSEAVSNMTEALIEGVINFSRNKPTHLLN